MKSIDLEQLVRPGIRALKPYHSAREDHLEGVLLDANENAYGSVVSSDGVPLNRYPDPHQRVLRTGLARLNDVSIDRIFAGVGSDEVIDLLIRVFCEPTKDAVLILEPTYGMYRVAASVQGARVHSCLLTDDFQIDVDRTLASVERDTKLIFCCSPNNPTGNLLHPERILQLCRSTSALVVVDEAYADFSRSSSIATLGSDVPNLVVLRTFSKAWGLAGIRLGYCIAHPAVVSYLMKIKSPYNLNVLTVSLALDALAAQDRLEQVVGTIVTERDRLMREIAELRCVDRVFPSAANFFLVRFKNAQALYGYLAGRNIIVRDRSSEPKLANCLRITVGTPSENRTLTEAIKEFDRAENSTGRPRT